MSQVSAKEQHELDMIDENLTHDPVKKKWSAKYPLTESPKLISDTKPGCLKILGSLEKRLQKANLTEEYRGQIEDFIKRGVITKMNKEELEKHQDQYYIPQTGH